MVIRSRIQAAFPDFCLEQTNPITSVVVLLGIPVGGNKLFITHNFHVSKKPPREMNVSLFSNHFTFYQTKRKVFFTIFF